MIVPTHRFEIYTLTLAPTQLEFDLQTSHRSCPTAPNLLSRSQSNQII
jgi:hypothetical protein